MPIIPATVCGAGMGSLITEKIPPMINPVNNVKIISFMLANNDTTFNTSYQSFCLAPYPLPLLMTHFSTVVVIFDTQ